MTTPLLVLAAPANLTARQKKPFNELFFSSSAIKMEIGQGRGCGGVRRRKREVGLPGLSSPNQRDKVMLAGALVI